MNGGVGIGTQMTLTSLGSARIVKAMPENVPQDPKMSIEQELMLDPDFALTPRTPHSGPEPVAMELSDEDKEEVEKLKAELAKPAPKIEGYLPVRIGLLGNSFTGKTCLIDTFAHKGAFSPIPETLGMGFMVRDIVINHKNVLLTFYDLGGRKEFVPLLPMAVVGAAVVLYVFDLENVKTINAIKDWYRQGKLVGPQLNVLVGTKYDLFVQHGYKFQNNVTEGTKAFAKAMHAPLFFTSSMYNVNVLEVFKVVLSMLCGIEPDVTEITETGEPIRLFRPPYCPINPVVLPPDTLALASEAKCKVSPDDVELEDWDVEDC